MELALSLRDKPYRSCVTRSSSGEAQEGQVVASNCGNTGGELDHCGEEKAKLCSKTSS